ncbi:signal peptidase I [Williamsia sterculiae]|uniref:Signal peptidase I n=1 Tax=Williamsia sterculiae TaxID=1344003 RepID=A0A1N7GII9_9NOCA|nr:signal peptidase I [Williamsia sterculiae]SIS12346.1 signal peptidase I [Williamsia sterculiae]
MTDTPSGSRSPHDERDGDERRGDEHDGGARPWHTRGEPDDKRGGRGRSLLREAAIIVVCVLVLTWVIQTFVGRQYVIPSESMETTLIGCQGCTNDRIVIDKIVYRFGSPEPGDVVVFKGPTSSWDEQWTSPRSSNTIKRGLQNGLAWFGFAPPDENDLVKRVVATGGQTVECHAADKVGVKVNGKPLKEPYVNADLQRQEGAGANVVNPDGTMSTCLGPDFGPITIPRDHVWVMGDNRSNSADSRYHMTDEMQGTVPIGDIRGKVRFIIYPFSRIGGVGAVNPQS